MNLFKIVKESVTVKQTAALYGLPVTTTWMTRCPFHEDHTPSMKLNDTYYYCFGCGATGDVIDLTAQLFGLSSFQAARKLTQDFGLSPDKPPSGAVALPKPAAASSDTQQEEIFYCLRVLHDYRDLLTRWQTEFAPLSPEEPLDEHFVEALYTIYKMWCEENNLVALKARSFSDAVIANLKKYNLEHTNNIANSAGRRVWGYLGIEALVRPEMPTSLWG